MSGTWRDIGELPVQGGKLYMPTDLGEIDVAEFDGYVKIRELEVSSYVLGSTNSMSKRLDASFIICGDVMFRKGFNFDTISTGRSYSAFADVYGRNIHFTGLYYDDNSNPLKRELVFEIRDYDVIRQLLAAGGYKE